MERRTMFKSLLTKNEIKPEKPIPPQSSLAKYEGVWERDQILHLLRRTTYTVNLDIVEKLSADGLDGSIEYLTRSIPLPDPPINYDFEGDVNVAKGDTWVNSPYYRLNGYQLRSIRSWTFGRYLSKEVHIREKMVMFWHNHFPVGDVNDSRFMFDYNTLLRQFALGNFKELTKQITISPIMLRYLNGNQNTRNSPNENYARELLELFTIGKGDLAGPGDYTHFTEHDVREFSKILTGWRDRGYRNQNNAERYAEFRANVHDQSTKTLSHRFGGVSIENEGDQEYSTLIDIIFKQDEVSRFIARKLYRWFVYYHIDENIESNIIEPMAQIIRDNDYSIKEAVIALLSSEHFYSSEMRGCMIKNPFDFICGFMNLLSIDDPDDILVTYNYWRRISGNLTPLQMVFYSPPDVAGWKAYYQGPSYYRVWLNSVTMPLRKVFTDGILRRGFGNFVDKPDLVEYISRVSDPLDINILIEELSSLFFSKPLSENQTIVLKDFIISGLPDFEWTVEYGDYLADPDNTDLKRSIQTKLEAMFTYMARMPEFQLS